MFYSITDKDVSLILTESGSLDFRTVLRYTLKVSDVFICSYIKTYSLYVYMFYMFLYILYDQMLNFPIEIYRQG